MKTVDLLFVLSLCLNAVVVNSFKFRLSRTKVPLLKLGFDDIEGSQENVIIEVITRRPVEAKSKIVSRSENVRCIATAIESDESDSAYGNVYKEYKEEKIEKMIDSRVGQVVGFLFNPSVLLLMLWASGNWVSWTQKNWFQKILSMFGKGTLATKEDGTKPVAKELPFQIFECEICKMEMRPARGRAEIIFGKERFRCSRCGSKASAYFDIDNMEDERAVARLERKKREEEEKDNYDDVEEEESDEDDEK